MKHVIYGMKYLAQYWLTGKKDPLICGLVLHNKCSLRCKHCSIVNRPTSSMSFDEAVEVMDSFYAKGGRCLYLEGGEPFIWKDNDYTMEDVVKYAKWKGYYTVVIYTNGLKPLETGADTLFVSMDGLQETHDYLRGKSFDRIMKNVLQSKHQSMYINYTINTVNYLEIPDFCEYISKVPQVKGTFFYFHTPYYGFDELFLGDTLKKKILRQLIALKKSYNILNSTAGLKSALRNDWKKKLDICQVYEGGKYYTCCRDNKNGAVCKDCGYLSYAEIDQTLKLKPGAIVNALKYF